MTIKMNSIDFNYYNKLAEQSTGMGSIAQQEIIRLLTDPDIEILPLITAAYQVRKQYFGKKIKIHILNNAQSGNCSQNCSYCAQSINANNKDISYTMKNDEEIISEAKSAFEAGAFRHCIVFSGKELSDRSITRLCAIVKKIKAKYAMEICISAGLLTQEKAELLKAAGVDRYNHNINTSRNFYPQICTTHTFQERINTIQIAKMQNFELCSGVIFGLGESIDDVVSIIEELKLLKPHSIPINFFIPVKGHRIQNQNHLTPELCLRILCIFRFAFPNTEIRIAGGREYHIRSLQPLCLFIVDSLFAEGYLTTNGDNIDITKNLISDCNFQIEKIET